MRGLGQCLKGSTSGHQPAAFANSLSYGSRHQLSAVQFMIAREDEEDMLSLWEPTTINYRDG